MCNAEINTVNAVKHAATREPNIALSVYHAPSSPTSTGSILLVFCTRMKVSLTLSDHRYYTNTKSHFVFVFSCIIARTQPKRREKKHRREIEGPSATSNAPGGGWRCSHALICAIRCLLLDVFDFSLHFFYFSKLKRVEAINVYFKLNFKFREGVSNSSE